MANRLFFDYAAQVQELRCTIVYTVPISTLYSPRGIGTDFDRPTIVPMVNIYEFAQTADRLDYNEAGLQALVNLLERRMDTSKIFASEQELYQMIKASGGACAPPDADDARSLPNSDRTGTLDPANR
ncbi:MAG: hypothetical protein RML75_06350 [Cyanobacteriota bacterium SKYGB_h_bin112]|nr:hypothetical protein [Cyanobacteriota bacterium SKYGB_h_bin112]